MRTSVQKSDNYENGAADPKSLPCWRIRRRAGRATIRYSATGVFGATAGVRVAAARIGIAAAGIGIATAGIGTAAAGIGIATARISSPAAWIGASAAGVGTTATRIARIRLPCPYLFYKTVWATLAPYLG